MKNILDQAKERLLEDENIVSYLQCSLETFIYRSVMRPVVFVLTNRRLFFCGPDIAGNTLFEEFSFDNISTIKVKKDLFGTKISIQHDTEWIKIKHIQHRDPSGFVKKIEEMMVA
ncbi:PH domain-containing protein [Bacillus sp. XF8]|uniref:PH domain-containing protein n=1 Tax=Bacillus sp. XF8 TaxID=2819289 RepID=UPI001AA06F80|nr:PH domain-containing protein [Bacillus sp. XF8]MBO1581336.1 PH domain-containing protein [Bacillus sp. XF8]